MAEYTESIQVELPELFTLVGPSADVDAASRALDQAAVVVETISGVVFNAEFREAPITRSDALWVKKATLFQAAWLIEQQDALNRVAVNSLTQDGLHVTTSNELTFVLAPLAKRALNNCSWAKHGTTRVSLERSSNGGSILISDNHSWSPIGSA